MVNCHHKCSCRCVPKNGYKIIISFAIALKWKQPKSKVHRQENSINKTVVCVLIDYQTANPMTSVYIKQHFLRFIIDLLMFSKSSQTQRNVCCITYDLLKLNCNVLKAFYIKQTSILQWKSEARSNGDQKRVCSGASGAFTIYFYLPDGYIVTVQCFINVVQVRFYVLFCMCKFHKKNEVFL